MMCPTVISPQNPIKLYTLVKPVSLSLKENAVKSGQNIVYCAEVPHVTSIKCILLQRESRGQCHESAIANAFMT
jgi:hypothetical protein